MIVHCPLCQRRGVAIPAHCPHRWEIVNRATGYKMGRYFATRRAAREFIDQLKRATSIRLYWTASKVKP